MPIHSRSHSRGPWVRCLALMGLVSYLGGMGWFMTLCTAALALTASKLCIMLAQLAWMSPLQRHSSASAATQPQFIPASQYSTERRMEGPPAAAQA